MQPYSPIPLLEPMDFRAHPIAWSFHRHTTRWPFNTLDEPEFANPTPPFKQYPAATEYPLPEPKPHSGSLQRAIQDRFSCRDYQPYDLPLEELATLLYAAYGVRERSFLNNSEFMERTVPSGGGLYSLEMYVLARSVKGCPPGIYHYNVLPPHSLELVAHHDLSPLFVGRLFMNQFYLENCSAIVFMTSWTERSLWKYGDRGYRYILFEAGHAAQNLNLTAQSIGLASLNMGGFFDHTVCDLLEIDQNREIPLYAVAIGRASRSGKARFPADEEQLD